MLVIPSKSGIEANMREGRIAEVIVKDELYTTIKWLDTEEISNGHYHHRFVEYTGSTVIELAFPQGVVLEYQGTSELLLFKDIITLNNDDTQGLKELWFEWLKEAPCSELAILY